MKIKCNHKFWENSENEMKNSNHFKINISLKTSFTNFKDQLYRDIIEISEPEYNIYRSFNYKKFAIKKLNLEYGEKEKQIMLIKITRISTKLIALDFNCIYKNNISNIDFNTIKYTVKKIMRLIASNKYTHNIININDNELSDIIYSY